MVLLSDKAIGSLIRLDGQDYYIVSHTATGTKIKKKVSTGPRPFDSRNKNQFSPAEQENIGWYLNNTFYNSLSLGARNALVQSTWNIGNESNESSKTVVAYVGLLTRSEWMLVGVAYGGSIPSQGHSEWLITQADYFKMSIINSGGGVGYSYDSLTPSGTNPVLVLKQGTQLSADGEVLLNNTPTNTTIPNQSTQLDVNKTVNLTPYFSDADSDVLTYTASSSNMAIGTVSVSGSTLTLSPVALGSTTITVTANDGKGGTVSTTFTFSVVNTPPSVAITAPSANQTLYENDAFNLAGTVSDVDSGNSVTVRYQINANTVRAIKAFISDGSTPEAFSKTLTFKSGSLYDGDTLIAGNLSDGVAHTLKVWATDDQGGTSVIAERAFYSVPNRAPSLSINPISTAGTIDNDKFTISGAFSDPDGNQATVRYRINGSNSVQVASGVSGVFDFDVSFGQLVIGTNNIVVEVQDSMGSKSSKTIKLTKNKIETPLLRSTERYKIVPPTGSTRGVLLWIHRDPNLDINVAISMGMVGEAESYTPLAVINSGPSPGFDGVIEDEFYIESDTAKDNIILQIDMTRSSVDVNDSIVLIQGVLE